MPFRGNVIGLDLFASRKVIFKAWIQRGTAVYLKFVLCCLIALCCFCIFFSSIHATVQTSYSTWISKRCVGWELEPVRAAFWNDECDMVHHSTRSIQKEHCDHGGINLVYNAEVSFGISMILTRCSGVHYAKKLSHSHHKAGWIHVLHTIF